MRDLALLAMSEHPGHVNNNGGPVQGSAMPVLGVAAADNEQPRLAYFLQPL
jgi:hypothetical protein